MGDFKKNEIELFPIEERECFDIDYDWEFESWKQIIENRNHKWINFDREIVPKYYFSSENNLQLRYYKKFNFNQLHFDKQKPNNNDEINTSVTNFKDYFENQIDTDIEKLKAEFMEYSHTSFLYSKSMCQDLLKNGVHHPIGIVCLRPSAVNSHVEKFNMDTG